VRVRVRVQTREVRGGYHRTVLPIHLSSRACAATQPSCSPALYMSAARVPCHNRLTGPQQNRHSPPPTLSATTPTPPPHHPSHPSHNSPPTTPNSTTQRRTALPPPPCRGRNDAVTNATHNEPNRRQRVRSQSTGGARISLISILVCEENQWLGAVRGVCCIYQCVLYTPQESNPACGRPPDGHTRLTGFVRGFGPEPAVVGSPGIILCDAGFRGVPIAHVHACFI
jgi:hypothetical protein